MTQVKSAQFLILSAVLKTLILKREPPLKAQMRAMLILNIWAQELTPTKMSRKCWSIILLFLRLMELLAFLTIHDREWKTK